MINKKKKAGSAIQTCKWNSFKSGKVDIYSIKNLLKEQNAKILTKFKFSEIRILWNVDGKRF